MNQSSRRRGFAMADALVAMLILMILFALSLPAIQATRERARATQCSNNLKNIVLGLQNYHDTYKVFPAGAMHAGRKGESERMGPAWWYGLLPFTEQRNLYDKIASTQRPGFRTANVPFNAHAINGTLDNLLAKIKPAFMRCPSSPLPVMEQANGPIALPTYVGISGGCDISHDSSDYESVGSFPLLKAPKSNRRYYNVFKGIAPHNGVMTSSGILPPNEHMNIARCSDGTSNTIIVGEQSDWLRDDDSDKPAKLHGDPGWDTDGTAGTGPKDGGGFLSGTAASLRIPRLQPPNKTPAPWGVDCYNVTTVRYRLNAKHVLGTRPHPGCSEDHGPNNPLQSAHPGGVLVGFVDGSVMPLSENADLAILLRMAIRDDGQNVWVGTSRDRLTIPMEDHSTDHSGVAVAPAAPAPAGTSGEKAALAFVRACFLDRDAQKAVAFLDDNAEHDNFGKGSAVDLTRQMVSNMPSPDSFRLSEIHFFRKDKLDTLRKRFPSFEYDRIERRIGNGLGCLLGLTLKTPGQAERLFYMAYVFQEQAGEIKVVFSAVAKKPHAVEPEARESRRIQMGSVFAIELDRARKTIDALEPEIKSHKRDIALEEIKLADLEKKLKQDEEKLAKRWSDIERMRDDLAKGDSTYVYAGGTYTAKQVETDLTGKFARYITSEATVEQNRNVLEIRRKALSAGQDKLRALLAAKLKLELEVEKLEARLKIPESAKGTSELSIDDRQLARIRQLLGDIEASIKVDVELVNADDLVFDKIQLDEPAENGNVLERIAEYEAKKTPKKESPTEGSSQGRR